MDNTFDYIPEIMRSKRVNTQDKLLFSYIWTTWRRTGKKPHARDVMADIAINSENSLSVACRRLIKVGLLKYHMHLNTTGIIDFVQNERAGK